ncbi:MAG TPA: 4a-hydroxytetrahydrobiopterin dehydratase [Dongiaceae bacterium]|jgi:4a-hydroxytetrahydrobiopterin dehydratase|nr:4a-hydroxytetrahydrobiopterin dehydratase [Dongiaceae bacterium]
MITRLSENARAEALSHLTAWRPLEDREAIHRAFSFQNFREAWSFMSEIALLAERMDHHPEWANVYNRVEIVLATHDCDGLSERDIVLAQAIDAVWARYTNP